MKILTVSPAPTAGRSIDVSKTRAGLQRGQGPLEGEPLDKVTRGDAAPASMTYDSSATVMNNADVSSLIRETEAIHQRLRDLVAAFVRQQGLSLDRLAQLSESGTTEIAVQEDLEALLGPGGDLGVEAVSNRIIAFAKALSGGDSSRKEELRAAIVQGFREAEAVLGTLPDISRQTYEQVMKKLDAWMSEA